MPLLVDTKTPERLEIGSSVYLIKPPSVMERARWRRAIVAAGGRRHGQLALLECLADGVSALMADNPPEVRDSVLALIQTHRDTVLGMVAQAVSGAFDDANELAQEDRDALRAQIAGIEESGKALSLIETAVLAGYPRYAEMAADDAAYSQIAGLEGARLFLMGWEGLDGTLARGPGGVSEQSLAQIPEGHFSAIGNAVEALTRVPEKKRKNSVSPPSSSPGGENSSTSKDARSELH
jgi:hypothetical protein